MCVFPKCILYKADVILFDVSGIFLDHQTETPELQMLKFLIRKMGCTKI